MNVASRNTIYCLNVDNTFDRSMLSTDDGSS